MPQLSVTLGDDAGNITATTLTAVPSTLETIPLGGLHYVGGSNTWMAVLGYHEQPDEAGVFIPNWHSGGGSLWRWSVGASDYRSNFISNGGADASAVWWNILIRAGEGGTDYYSMVDNTINWLTSVIPANTRVFCSPLHSYGIEPGGNILNHEGHVDVCEYAVATHGLLRGPGLAAGYPYGPLVGNEIANDGRHPSSDGRLKLGAWLVDFFDPYAVGV